MLCYTCLVCDGDRNLLATPTSATLNFKTLDDTAAENTPQRSSQLCELAKKADKTRCETLLPNKTNIEIEECHFVHAVYSHLRFENAMTCGTKSILAHLQITLTSSKLKTLKIRRLEHWSWEEMLYTPQLSRKSKKQINLFVHDFKTLRILTWKRKTICTNQLDDASTTWPLIFTWCNFQYFKAPQN